MKFLNTVAAVLSLSVPVAALAYNITGTVHDRQGEPLTTATVRLLAARDSSYINGVAADVDGKFTLTGVKSGKYIVETSYIGYAKAYNDVSVRKSNVDLGDIHLDETGVMLREVGVTGVKTPIKVMEDTVEFNADTYKTPPNAVVEDLLKRLPGVEVDSDGKITANGKTVTKILLDGKEFFADDPKVASKNLPVNMVDKLQVVDRKSDLARLTGVDDGEDETVINLTVKKGMQNGWFGTVEAGYGTDDRYQGTFNINRFWDGNQITFIGSANNTNDLGFTDGNGSRFRRFGGDNGINESQSFGVNFSLGRTERFRVGGNVLYSHSDRDTRETSLRQYLFQDSTSYSDSRSVARDRGHNVRADFRIEWKPDSFNTFDFRPNFSFNQNRSTSDVIGENRAGDPGQTVVSRTYNNGDNRGTSYEARGRLIYNHNFRNHRGRSISLMANYSMSNVTDKDKSYSRNLFYLLDNDSIIDQYIHQHTWNNRIAGRVTWTEPIGDVANGNFLTVGYNMSYRWNNADKDVYDVPVITNGTDDLTWFEPDYSLQQYNDTLSNRFRNNMFTQEIRLGYKRVTKLYTLDLGVTFNPTMSRSTNLTNADKTIPTRWDYKFAPFLRFRYKIGKTTSFNALYRGHAEQPSISQLQPVADYSDPLRVVQGNPSLVPTFTHHLMLRHQHFNPERQFSTMTMMHANIELNSIVSRTTYNPETSGQYTTYENVNGVWNIRLMNMVSLPIGHSKQWTFNNNAFINYSQSVGYNNGDRNMSRNFMGVISPSIAWRPENLELELRPVYHFQTTGNSLKSVASTTVHRYGGRFDGSWYSPWGLVLATDLNYSATSGYSAGYDQDQWMWNASISYQFLKNRAATVQLKVYDLLQQKSNINRSVTANYITDSEYNSLTRYFMVTFTYKFNTFGAGNEPASQTGFRGPMGPPPGGHRPH